MLTRIECSTQDSGVWYELAIVTFYAIKAEGVEIITLGVRTLVQLYPIDRSFIVVWVECPNRKLGVRGIEPHADNRIEERRRFMQAGEEMLLDGGSIERIEEETEMAIPYKCRKC